MAKRTRSSAPPQTPGKPLPGSLGEFLDEIGFRPLGRRVLVRPDDIAKELPVSIEWAIPAIEFFRLNLPRDPAGRWKHRHISAYEVAVEALQAFAEVVSFGGCARPVAEPKLQEMLPRWDDTATAVVYLASHSRLLRYRKLVKANDERREPRQPRPNIRAAHGSPPAYLAPRALPTFQSLGLILDRRWTPAAETILWRDSPFEAGIDFTKNPRFIEALDSAVATVPKDIGADIRSMVTITEDDITGLLEFAKRHLPVPGTRTRTRDDALLFLQTHSCHCLDRLFARRWRFSDGWMSGSEIKRALYFQYDALAIEMRIRFAARYLPEFPFLYNSDEEGD